MINAAIRPWAEMFSARITQLAGDIGYRVSLDCSGLIDRSDAMRLDPPAQRSANGSCRLLPSRDGWLAVNLARPDDWELLPAWIDVTPTPGDWSSVTSAVRDATTADLLAQGTLLGLAVSALGETVQPENPVEQQLMGSSRHRIGGRLNVVDMTSLWAGPLCGAVLQAAGATVYKVESHARPDTTWRSAPRFDRRLNGGKIRQTIDFGCRRALDGLLGRISAADILITSVRPRAFEALGLSPERVFARNPSLIWVAITAHGWSGEGAHRIGFGDDAAVAGRLVAWDAAGEPMFIGDAVADPLTGLAAAAGALHAYAKGGGFLIDASLARTAAWCAGTYAG